MSPMLSLGSMQWLPDQPAIGNPGLLRCEGLVPTAQGYRPFRNLTGFVGSIPNRALGGVAGRDLDGVPFIAVGDATKLHLLRTLAFVASTPTYTLGSDDVWEMQQFQQFVIATPWVSAMQVYDLRTNTPWAALGTGAPRAKHIGVVRDFLVCGYCFDSGDATNGNRPYRVWWSPRGNPTGTWETPGTSAAYAVQTGYRDLPGSGGAVQRVIGTLEVGLAFQERAVWRMDYVGGDEVFAFNRIDNERGLLVPASAVSVGRTVYYLASDGFRATEGLDPRPIGLERVNRTVLDEMDRGFFHRWTATSDPNEPVIYWCYPAKGDGGVARTWLAYHYELNRWSRPSAQEVELLIRMVRPGRSLDDYPDSPDLDSGSPPWDKSLDSQAFLGGGWQLGGFSGTHSLGEFTGSPGFMYLETGDQEFVPNGRALLRGARPVTDSSFLFMAFGHRNVSNEAVTWSPIAGRAIDGMCYALANGRYHRLALTLVGSFDQVQGFDVDVAQEGRH